VLCLVLGAGLLLSPAATAKKKAKTKTVTKATTVQNPASVPIPGGTNNPATSTFLPGSASSAVTIPDSGTLTKVTVGVQVTFPHTFELQLYLVHGSNFVTLANGVANGTPDANFGGGTGCNGGITVFDDAASQFHFQGTNPFAGTFRPSFALAGFNGDNVNGAWSLLVINNSGMTPPDTGTINCVKVNATYRQTVKKKTKKKK
jgi:subtilisin-like proprotein convertase family protein